MNFGFSNICLLPGGRSFNYYLHLCVKKEVFRSHSWNNNALLIPIRCILSLTLLLFFTPRGIQPKVLPLHCSLLCLTRVRLFDPSSSSFDFHTVVPSLKWLRLLFSSASDRLYLSGTESYKRPVYLSIRCTEKTLHTVETMACIAIIV